MNISTKLTSSNLLHGLFLSGDGNFHMQSKIHCKDVYSDPSLFGDSALFAPHALLQNYIEAAKEFRPTAKVRYPCFIRDTNWASGNSQDAVCATQAGSSERDRPNSKFSKGGIYAIQCKHGLYRKHGVADFPKGER
jgi:hypothetical protein